MHYNGTKSWLRKRFTAANGRSFLVSVGVVRGARPGPVFANVAGQHGMEHIGPMVLRDLFDEIDPKKLKGTLYLCPSANPLALEHDFEVYPEREKLSRLKVPRLKAQMFGYKKRDDLGAYNMNRVWDDDIGVAANASKRKEGVARQIARWLWKTMIAPADFVIDHHSVRHSLKPYIFCEEPVVPWTPLLGFEGVWCTGPLAKEPTAYPYRRLCLQAIRHGKVGICIEYSRQHVIRESDRALGRFAVLNVMKALGMIAGKPQFPRRVWLIPGPYREHLREFTSTHTGHAHYFVDEYEPLKKGQKIAEVRDLQTNKVVQVIRSPYRSLMLHRNWRPIARPKEWLCRIATEFRLLAEPGKPYCMPSLERTQ